MEAHTARVIRAVAVGDVQADDTPHVLGAIRQSKTRDRALSPETQRKRINAWTDDNDSTVVKFTVDLSTSGGKSAFRRKGLGPWLTEPDKIKTWDVLVVTRLDRACRDVADYLKLSAWCDRHGKRFVVLDDPAWTPARRAAGPWAPCGPRLLSMSVKWRPNATGTTAKSKSSKATGREADSPAVGATIATRATSCQTMDGRPTCYAPSRTWR
jgi:hypothetical protein